MIPRRYIGRFFKYLAYVLAILVILHLIYIKFIKMEDQEFYQILHDNAALYEELKAAELKSVSYMQNTPKDGMCALVVNCSDKKAFYKAVKIGQKHKIKGNLELQISTVRFLYCKTDDSSYYR